MLMGGYRQLNLPINSRTATSHSTEEQIKRLEIIVKQIIRATTIGKNVVIGMDMNIDNLEENDPLGREDIRDLYIKYEDFRNMNSFSILNKEPTFYRPNAKPSLLDHILTNCQNNIDNIQTYFNIMSDHRFVTCLFHTEEIVDSPQFSYYTNWRNADYHSYTDGLMNNEKLNSMFNHTDPDIVWPLFITGLNEVIDTQFPTKVIQLRKGYKPYINEEIKEMYDEAKSHLELGINQNDNDEFRMFRSIRNRVYKAIDAAKQAYFESIIPNSKNMWRNLQDLAGKKEFVTPRRLIHSGNMITSQKRIANITNDFFIEKIDKI